MLPRIERLGVATAAGLDVDTLDQHLAEERRRTRAKTPDLGAGFLRLANPLHVVFPVKYRKSFLDEEVVGIILETAQDISDRYAIDYGKH